MAKELPMTRSDPNRRAVVAGIAATAGAAALASALPGMSTARAQTAGRGVALITGCVPASAA